MKDWFQVQFYSQPHKTIEETSQYSQHIFTGNNLEKFLSLNDLFANFRAIFSLLYPLNNYPIFYTSEHLQDHEWIQECKNIM